MTPITKAPVEGQIFRDMIKRGDIIYVCPEMLWENFVVDEYPIFRRNLDLENEKPHPEKKFWSFLPYGL